MRNIILVNTNAATVRKRPGMAEDIVQMCPDAQTIITDTASAAQDRLLDACEGGASRVFVVGGDGTFRLALDVLAQLPRDERPAVTAVGGGQFNYMSRFCGYRSRDPVVNLWTHWRMGFNIEITPWRPVLVRDEAANRSYRAALFADGVVGQFIDLYEREGKGSMRAVLRLIARSAWQIAAGLGNPPPAFAPVEGDVFVDGRPIATRYVGVMAGSLNEFLPWCKPFAGRLGGDQCYSIAYRGGYVALAASVPWLWRGWRPWWISRQNLHNAPAEEVTIRTRQSFMVLDGDLVTLPQPTTLRITRAQAVSLLRVS